MKRSRDILNFPPPRITRPNSDASNINIFFFLCLLAVLSRFSFIETRDILDRN